MTLYSLCEVYTSVLQQNSIVYFQNKYWNKSNASSTNLQCTGGALEASATVAVVWQDAAAAVETAPCAHRFLIQRRIKKIRLSTHDKVCKSVGIHYVMDEPTCLTLQPFPAGGTLARVWSQTLAAIFTFLQANSCSKITKVQKNVTTRKEKKHDSIN